MSRNCFKMVSTSRTVRNGACLRRSSLDKVYRDNDPPGMVCLLERAASVRTHAYACGRVWVCVCVCAACIGLHAPHHSTTEGNIKRQLTYEPLIIKSLRGPLEAFSRKIPRQLTLLVPKPQHTPCIQRTHFLCASTPPRIRVLPCHCDPFPVMVWNTT